MRHTRLLVSILLVALGALSVGVATARLSDSAKISYEITAAGDFGEKVWVCRLVGPPHDPKVKKGENPIHVSVNSIHAEEGFSDVHPSYVVEHGNVECSVPEEDAEDRSPREKGRVEPPPIPSTSTSTTSTSSTTSTTTTTTTTTTTSPTITSTSTTTTTTTTTTTSPTITSTSTTSTTTTTTTTPPDS